MIRQLKMSEEDEDENTVLHEPPAVPLPPPLKGILKNNFAQSTQTMGFTVPKVERDGDDSEELNSPLARRLLLLQDAKKGKEHRPPSPPPDLPIQQTMRRLSQQLEEGAFKKIEEEDQEKTGEEGEESEEKEENKPPEEKQEEKQLKGILVTAEAPKVGEGIEGEAKEEPKPVENPTWKLYTPETYQQQIETDRKRKIEEARMKQKFGTEGRLVNGELVFAEDVMAEKIEFDPELEEEMEVPRRLGKCPEDLLYTPLQEIDQFIQEKVCLWKNDRESQERFLKSCCHKTQGPGKMLRTVQFLFIVIYSDWNTFQETADL